MGTNAYVMKKLLALAHKEEAAFLQFSGDLVDGYTANPGHLELQFANWRRAAEPYWHYLPIYVTMGNHESLSRKFDDGSQYSIQVDRFPFATSSGEALFAKCFTNPMNGPDSEDGAAYDPDPKQVDFPSYKENVFFYTYDNVGVIVLNSNYLYTPSKKLIPQIGGGLHGYIMDRQIEWFKETLARLEADGAIDHIFVTQHTPFFPNGGHRHDDMWYDGDNNKRPYIAGKRLKHGIIERRDHLLDLIANHSQKALAILTGDEHNYALTKITSDTKIHPSNYIHEKITVSRPIYQVNNGAAGAPYYGQQETPWTPSVLTFTPQNALVLFDVEGPRVRLRVLNPVTLEEIETRQLR